MQHCWSRGPSRLIWFTIGAFSATWWIKHKHNYHHRICSRPDLPTGSYGPVPPVYPSAAVPTSSLPPPPPAANSNPNATNVEKEQRWNWNVDVKTPPAPAPASAPAPGGTDKWEDERKSVQEIGRQASETIVEVSEATLDTMLSTVEYLKHKLAEHKAQRDQQVREWQTMREEQMRQLEEWRQVQQQQQQQQQPQTPPSPTPRHIV